MQFPTQEKKIHADEEIHVSPSLFCKLSLFEMQPCSHTWAPKKSYGGGDKKVCQGGGVKISPQGGGQFEEQGGGREGELF